MASASDVARMRRIIGHLRAVDVTVREIPGWESRGADWTRQPRGIIDHHDASTWKSGEWGSLGIIVSGRAGIPGPLSQFQVSRGLDGVPKVAIIGAGRANHAGRGGPEGPVPRDAGNSWLYGAEKAADGIGEKATPAADYAADALFWAVLQETAAPDLLIGHKEWTPRKIDPVYSMEWRRQRVESFRPTTSVPEDDMSETIGPGSNEAVVKLLQRCVQREAVLSGRAGEGQTLVADGDYGPKTTAAVAAYQAGRVQSARPGIVGGVTASLLFRYENR